MAFVSSFSGVALAAPTRVLVSARPRVVRVAKSQTRMSLAPIAQDVSLKLADMATLIASKEADFGGYTGPMIGLLLIGIIIAVLTPPIKE